MVVSMQPFPTGETSSCRVALPKAAVEHALKHPLLRALVPTDLGIGRSDDGRRFESLEGIPQAILIYCAKGRGWCKIDGTQHEVRAGSLLVIPPHTPYAFGADPIRPWTTPWVQMTGENIGLLLKELGVTVRTPILNLGDDPQIVSLFENAVSVASTGGPCATTKMFHVAQSVGHLLAFINSRRRQPAQPSSDPKERIARCVEYMKRNLGERLQLDQLAAQCCLSTSRFGSLFREATGETPMEYLTRLRMERACELLTDTEQPIKEIAMQVGYPDPYWFSNAFRSLHAMSPSEFRDRGRGG